jgi:hypothetical protein
MTVPNLVGLMLRHSELEIRSDIITQLVFCKHVLPPDVLTRGRIFTCVRPFYERAETDLNRFMHRSLWV